jgi:hypothetical protein
LKIKRLEPGLPNAPEFMVRVERFELIIKADLKSAASSNWATRARNFGIANCEFRIYEAVGYQTLIGKANPKSEIRNPQCFGTGGGIRTHTV